MAWKCVIILSSRTLFLYFTNCNCSASDTFITTLSRKWSSTWNNCYSWFVEVALWIKLILRLDAITTDDIVEILLFEDNPGDIGLIEEMLEEINDFSYRLKNVKTLNEGLTLLKNRTFDEYWQTWDYQIAKASTLFLIFIQRIHKFLS